MKCLVLLLLVGQLSCGSLGELPGEEVDQSVNSSPVRDRSPSHIVNRFWTLSLSGEVNEASELISAAPVSYLYWKARKGQQSNTLAAQRKHRYVPPQPASDGIGNSNPTFVDEEFADSLRGRAKLIHEVQMNLESIEDEIIEEDKAEVKVNLSRSGWVAFYEQRVLLRRVEGEWKIIAIWDGV